jgi:hypothetical protein
MRQWTSKNIISSTQFWSELFISYVCRLVKLYKLCYELKFTLESQVTSSNYFNIHTLTPSVQLKLLITEFSSDNNKPKTYLRNTKYIFQTNLWNLWCIFKIEKVMIIHSFSRKIRKQSMHGALTCTYWCNYMNKYSSKWDLTTKYVCQNFSEMTGMSCTKLVM